MSIQFKWELLLHSHSKPHDFRLSVPLELSDMELELKWAREGSPRITKDGSCSSAATHRAH
jgi:hypothetical protein